MNAAPSPAPQLDEPVARHARADFVALRAEQTVDDALRTLRRATLAERIVYFYVVDAAGALVGVLPTRGLLMSPPDRPIAEVMSRRVVALPSTATVFDACELFVLHRFLALPVVDDSRRLVGVVDVSLFTGEVFDAAERRTAADAFQLVGIRLAGARAASPWTGFRQRFPWLLCNVGGGIACALVASRYESLVGAAPALALFVPVVLALSESVSIQSMTLTLHGLHDGRPACRRLARTVAREAATALLLGAACGSAVGGTAWIWRGDAHVAAAIAGTITAAMVTACVLGVALPTLVHAFRGDPKVAAGPILLAAADIVTLALYFTLAGAILEGRAAS